MKVEVICIEPCDEHRPGDRFLCSEARARELQKKGLVKMRGPHSNKMREAPAGKNPTAAAGKTRPASASPAVQASSQQTAQPSGNGAHPRRQRAASSR